MLTMSNPLTCPALCRTPFVHPEAQVPYVPYAAVFAYGPHEHPL